jgi:hypothetical protein
MKISTFINWSHVFGMYILNNSNIVSNIAYYFPTIKGSNTTPQQISN